MRRTTLISSILAILGLSTALLIACGGVADSPDGASLPAMSTTAVEGQVDQAPVQQGLATTPSQPGMDSANLSTQPGVDDERVEALVAEWEADLVPISRVAQCVQQELGLGRPLLPEDLALQANQPAIVSCVKRGGRQRVKSGWLFAWL